MNGCNSGQNDGKIVKFCLVGVAWKTWFFWTVRVQGLQHNIPWLRWNSSTGNTFSRHLLHFLLCFHHFVKKYKLQWQLFEGRKKLSAKVYWVWKVWFICRNAGLKLAQHDGKDWVLAGLCRWSDWQASASPASRNELGMGKVPGAWAAFFGDDRVLGQSKLVWNHSLGEHLIFLFGPVQSGCNLTIFTLCNCRQVLVPASFFPQEGSCFLFI